MNSTLVEWASYIRSLPWLTIKEALELGLYYLIAIAAIGALFRLNAIGQILRDFLKARGPLWELQKTVDQLKELEPSILNLQAQVALMDERLEAAAKQVTELQAESVSSRSDSEEVEPDSSTTPTSAPFRVDEQDHNWNFLRDYWQRNRKRIEYVIDQISDGRTRLAYDRLPRTNYVRIIHKLQGQKLMSAAAATASKELIETFNRYRPRNKSIPDEVIGALLVLDAQLEKELVPYDTVVAAEEAEDSMSLARPQAGVRSNSISDADRPTHAAQIAAH